MDILEVVVIVVAGVVGTGNGRVDTRQSIVDLEDGSVPLVEVVGTHVDGKIDVADSLNRPQIVGYRCGHGG